MSGFTAVHSLPVFEKYGVVRTQFPDEFLLTKMTTDRPEHPVESMIDMTNDIDLGLYKSVVESANDAVIVTTPELNNPGPRIIYVNPAFARMTGWTAEEIHGQTPRVLQGPRTDRALLDRLRRDLQTQRSFHGEGINYRKDGSEYYVEWRIAPVEEKGKVLYWVAIQRDVSSRKRTEDRLVEDNQRKDTFLAMLAHELRNPLAPIRNSIFLMQKHLSVSTPEVVQEKFPQLLSIQDHQVDRMVRIMDDLLDISRIQRGTINLKISTCHLDEIIHHVSETVRPLFEAKHQQYTEQVQHDLQALKIDKTRIEQILINLLTNASKYSPEGGRISLRVTQDDECTQIQVQDNGQGINPDHLSRVFELFYQEKMTPSAEGGLGIGLTLVKQLIELHHGTITASSQGRDKGTIMSVQIPNEVALPTSAAKKGPQILLVDDNPDAANTLAMILESFGYQAQVFYRGTEAIEYFDQHKADITLAFLDLGLPDIAGLDIARHIRAEEECSPMLVAVTGWSQTQDRKATSKAGFNFHLSKPVDPIKVEHILAMLA